MFFFIYKKGNRIVLNNNILGDTMNYYDEIKNKIIDNEIYGKVKDYSKERYKLKTYIEIGELLYNANSQYGDKIIKKYSKRLSNDLKKI